MTEKKNPTLKGDYTAQHHQKPGTGSADMLPTFVQGGARTNQADQDKRQHIGKTGGITMARSGRASCGVFVICEATKFLCPLYGMTDQAVDGPWSQSSPSLKWIVCASKTQNHTPI